MNNFFKNIIIKGIKITPFLNNYILWENKNDLRHIFLTFDDGPHPVHTPKILNVLSKYDMKATFFVIGEKALKYKEILKDIISDGHIVGNHTFSHKILRKDDFESGLKDIEQGFEIIEDLIGRTCNLFRPTMGIMPPGYFIYLIRKKKRIVFWSKDPEDFSIDSTHNLKTRILNMGIANGDILLLHDRISFTADALDDICQFITNSGFTSSVIPDLL